MISDGMIIGPSSVFYLIICVTDGGLTMYSNITALCAQVDILKAPSFQAIRT